MCLQSLSLWAEATYYRARRRPEDVPAEQTPVEQPAERVMLEAELPRQTLEEPVQQKETVRV